MYLQTHGTLKDFLKNVICAVLTYTEHAKRKTITSIDVAGVRRISRFIYEETHGALKVLENAICDVVTYTEHAKRKTVTSINVEDVPVTGTENVYY
ncbi:hypothetical protein AB205_0184820, partial [Aquarana catesbeiana]